MPHPDVHVDYATDPVAAVADIITVHHNATNRAETTALHRALRGLHPNINLVAVSNQTINRGFAKACNIGAATCGSPIVGFLNPDVTVHRPFIGDVTRCFASDPSVMIAGNRWNKPARELQLWGLDEWVCGAAMFVRRSWWAIAGGFDEQFVWSWEETDFVRRTQEAGYRTVDLRLPIDHPVQGENTPYKVEHFNIGRDRYRAKWKEPSA